MTTPDTPSIPVRTIAGFWRRVFAFFIDALLLGVLGAVAGWPLGDEFARLGPWGRAVGFAVALIYFGAANSRLTGGQTLGKHLCKIKVVDRSGSPISVSKAVLRFLPLGAAWFLNNMQLPGAALSSIWLCLVSIAVFGIGLSILYFYIFNRKSRQSLHDLLVGSYVVSAEASQPVPASAPWIVHVVVSAGLIMASAIAPYVIKRAVAGDPFDSMWNAFQALESEPWVASVQINQGKKFFSSTSKGSGANTFLNITVYSKDPDIRNAARAKRLATLALSADKPAGAVDVVRVTIVYGYDIGIASSRRSQTQSHSPAEWLAQ